MKRIACALLLLAFLCPQARADYSWTLLRKGTPWENEDVKWVLLRDAGASGPRLFVANPNGLSSSTDGKTWQRAVGLTGTADYIVEHNGRLLAVWNSGNGTKFFTSDDGINWTLLDLPNVNNSLFVRGSYVASFQGYLYFITADGDLLRSKAANSGDMWETVSLANRGGADTNVTSSIAVFNGRLYRTRYTGSLPVALSIESSIDGQTWKPSFSTTTEPFLVIWGTQDALIADAPDSPVFRLPKSSQLQDAWIEDPPPVITGSYSTFVLFDRIHAISRGGETVRRQVGSASTSSPNAWEVAPWTAQLDVPRTEVPELRAIAYVAAGTRGVAILSRGVTSISVAASSDIQLHAGDQQATLLEWTMAVNGSDQVRQMTVQNGGSSTTSDFKSLALYRLSPSREKMVDFVPSSETTWSLPSGASPTMDDGATYGLVAEVADRPAKASTVQLFVPGSDLAFQYAAADQLSVSLAMDRAVVIQEGPSEASGLLSGVAVAPSPAKDRVHFFYDLIGPADVRVTVFDLTGSAVAQIDDPGKPAGIRQSTVWSTSGVGSGVYQAVVTIRQQDGTTRRDRAKVVVKK